MVVGIFPHLFVSHLQLLNNHANNKGGLFKVFSTGVLVWSAVLRSVVPFLPPLTLFPPFADLEPPRRLVLLPSEKPGGGGKGHHRGRAGRAGGEGRYYRFVDEDVGAGGD